MDRGTYTETDNWVAAKISWEPLSYGDIEIESWDHRVLLYTWGEAQKVSSFKQ